MINNFDDSVDEIYLKDQLIHELKGIIHEYENRLSAKDTNFQLQFSELQNELIGKESELDKINIEKQKLECELLELHDLVDEHNLIIKSKDTALQIIQDDLKNQLENVKSHYNETLSIRQEEIESLRLTGSQLREQLALREDDMIQVMQRHENQIINMFNEIETKTEQSDVDQMVKILKDQIANLREALIDKQQSLKIANDKLEAQDQIMRKLQETNLDLEEQVKRYEQKYYTDQTYQKHIETLNDTLKENKKKQLTFKAKAKSLEKQLASLKTLNDDKEKQLNSELLIRDEIIVKQNILIDELRQTENSLRQSLNRSIAIQEEQILELKYWENFNNLLPSFDFKDSYDSFSTEPLSMAIENLESLCSLKSKKRMQELQNTIEELCQYRTTIDQQNKYFRHLENQIKLLKNCVTNVNKFNIILNKHIGVLAQDYQQFYQSLKDFDGEIMNFSSENLDQCSKSELIKKIIIISNQMSCHSNSFLDLENENLRLNLEINKIMEVCSAMSLKIDNTYQEIESFLLTKNDNFNKLNFIEKPNDQTESSYVEKIFQIIIERNFQIRIEVQQKNNEEFQKLNKINENLNFQVKNLLLKLDENEIISNNKTDESEKFSREFEEVKCEIVLLEDQRENNRSIISDLTNENSSLKVELENLGDQLLRTTNENINMKENLKNDKINEEFCKLNSENALLKKLNGEITINESKLKDELKSLKKHLENNKIRIQEYLKEKEDGLILTEDLNKELLLSRNELKHMKINEIEMKNSISKLSNDYDNILNELDNLKTNKNMKDDEKCDFSDGIYLNNESVVVEAFYLSKESDNLITENKNPSGKKLEDIEHKMEVFEKEIEGSHATINCLKNENKSFKLEIENAKEFNKIIIKENENLKELKDNFLIDLEKNNRNFNLLTNEKKEMEILLVVMKEENMTLKTEAMEIEKCMLILKDDIFKSTEEKNKLLKMLSDQSDLIKKIEMENEENSVKLTNLIEENASLYEQLSQTTINSKELNENLSRLQTEKSNVINELENVMATVLVYQKEKDDNSILRNDLNNEIIILKHKVAEMVNFEETLKVDLHIASVDRNQIMDSFENIKIKASLLEKTLEENGILLATLVENLSLKVTHLSVNLAKITEKTDNIIAENENSKKISIHLEQEQNNNETKFNEQLNSYKNERDKIISDLEEMRSKLIQIEKNKTDLEVKLTTLTEEKSYLTEIAELLNSSITKYQKEIANHVNIQNTLMKELEDVKYKFKTLEITSKEDEKLLIDFNNENSLLKDKFNKLLNDGNVSTQNLIVIEEEKNNILSEFGNLKLEMESVKSLSNQNENKIKLLLEENVILKNKFENSINSETELKANLLTIMDENTVLLEKIDIYQKQIKENGLLSEKLLEENSFFRKEIESLTIKNDSLEENVVILTEENDINAKELENLLQKLLKLTKGNEDNEIVLKNFSEKNKSVKHIINELNKIEEKLKEETLNGFNQIMDIKDNLIIKENEKVQQDRVIGNLESEVANLNESIEHIQTEKFMLKEMMRSIIEEKDKLSEECGKLEKSTEDKLSLIHSLNDQINLFQNAIAESSNEELKLKEHIETIKSEKNSIFENLENVTQKLFLLEKENHEKETILKEMENIKVLHLKETEQLNTQITELQDDLKTRAQEKSDLMGEIKVLRGNLRTFEQENQDNLSLIKDLNHQLIMLKKIVEELSCSEEFLKKEVVILKDEKTNLSNELEVSFNKIITFSKMKTADESMILELKESIHKLQDAESKLKLEYLQISNEKESLSKELIDLKNLKDEKASIDRENLTSTRSGGVISTDETNGEKEIQSGSNKEVLEKNYLVLKAKFLKFKKQSEEKINIVTKKNEELSKLVSIQQPNLKKTEALSNITKTIDSFCQCNIIDSSWCVQDIPVMLDSHKINPDEKFLYNQIENFSHEVDAKVRKVNFEIEEFLERNERVTSSLVSKSSPDRIGSGQEAQSEKFASKNRELSLTIKNLEEQNLLMKNKIIDLCNCLEKEQELYKQFNEEKIILIDDLTKKINLTITENFQLNLQINNHKEELKLITKEKQNLSEKITNLKEVLSNLSEKVSNLSTENSQITEDYRLLKLKTNQELYSKLEKLQSEINLSEIVNSQNKTKITELENCKFDLKNANKNLSKENNEIRQSTQVIINELMDKCHNHELENAMLNSKILEFEETNNKNSYLITSLQERINNFEISIQTKQENVYLDHKIFESIHSLNVDVENFHSELSEIITIKHFNENLEVLTKTSLSIYEQLHSCLTRISDVENQLQGVLHDRNDLQIQMRRMELDHSQILENKDKEFCELKELISEYEFALSNEKLISKNGTDFENSFQQMEHEEPVINYETLPFRKSKNETEPKIQVQNYVLNKLTDTFSMNTSEIRGDLKNDFENSFVNYLQIIKNSIPHQYSIKDMKNVETQTDMDLTYLQKLETEITQSLYEWQNLNEFSIANELIPEDFIGNIILYNRAMEIMNDKVIKLQKDLEIEELQKCEMSDKFEQIITELESACDAEVEKLKLNNEFLKQELEFLKCEREEQNSNMNLLKNQIFSLQLESTRQNLDFDTNHLIDAAVDTNEGDLSWMSNLNDALKQTISEKEDQVTELMKKLNESISKLKEAKLQEESCRLEIQNLNEKLNVICEEIKLKDRSIQDNFEVINELEVICIEKENRVNSLEKELVDINSQLEQYISAVCSMQARLEASKPNIESMLNKIGSRSNNLQLLNLIDQLEKDYADELEQSEITKSKIELKLNKAIQVINKLKKQLKQSHARVLNLNDEIKSLKTPDPFHKILEEKECHIDKDSTTVDVSTQTNFELDNIALCKEENVDLKGLMENLNVNNFILLRELDKMQNNDRTSRGSSLPPTSTGSQHTGKGFHVGSERSLSPVSQISSNSFDGGDSINLNQIKDLQRKLQRTNQQLNQMRIERNRIHQEYTRIRQMKEEADQKALELSRLIDSNLNQDDILHEKDQLIEMNNKYSVTIVELKAETEMTNVRNSILETKCKKMEWKLNNQRRKYDQLILKLDEKEQDIDNISDELRKNLSIFEKDRIDWLKERKELKLLNKNKDNKIVEFRKKLSNKTNETTENTENDYIIEIEQHKNQISQLKQENKQFLAQHREEINKYKGQLEELIDDNKQLKRKLTLDQKDNKMFFVENRVNNPLMHIIDEVSENSDSLWSSNTESNAILAKVVLEKEHLLCQLSETEKQLNDEKQKSSEYQFKTSILNESKIVNSISQFTQYEELFSKNNNNTNLKCGETQTYSSHHPIHQSTETSENYELEKIKQINSIMTKNDVNQNIQTEHNFDKEIINNYRLALINRLNIHKYPQIECTDLPVKVEIGVQTDPTLNSLTYHVIHQSTETSESYELEIMKQVKSKITGKNVNQNIQTEHNFDKKVINDYRSALINRLDIHRFPQIECTNLPVTVDIDVQTDPNKQLQIFYSKGTQISHSVGIQTVDDELTNELIKEIKMKTKIIEDSSRQIRTLENQMDRINYELNETGKRIALLENENLDYQETIGKLQLDSIEVEKKYKQCLGELNLEIGNYKELNDNKNKLVVQSENEESQVNELQLADGWDMEWEYENIANDIQNATQPSDKNVNNLQNSPENCLSKFLIELDDIFNHYSDSSAALAEIKYLISSYKSAENCDDICNSELSNNSGSVLNLVAILREEITQLKQGLNEKNNEIGHLKCLRNQLQADLLESGQQIKDSNMEFLNLKENIQAINAEKNMLRQKLEDLEIRFRQFVNFVRMLGVDLRRLRDSSQIIAESPPDCNVLDEQNVSLVTQSMEHELHKLLEKIYEKDIDLHKSINQIEQMTCALQRLQLTQKSQIFTEHNIIDGNPVNSKYNNNLSESNSHEECENFLTELSELLEKKQSEIEELKSRLFLATDQLIHFRAFYADPDFKLKSEYLNPNKNISPKWSSFNNEIEDGHHQPHIKVLVESEDDQFSDSDDQLMVSHAGSTVIKVEKSDRIRTPSSKTLFTRICGQMRNKKILNNIKSAMSADRGSLFFFRSQPRFNFKTLLTLYIMLIHVLLFHCMSS